MGHFPLPPLLYGNSVTVHTDHTAIKAVLESPHPTRVHARWWTRVYGQGIKEVRILYRAGKENGNADALSHNPVSSAPEHEEAEDEVQVSPVAVTTAQCTTELTNKVVAETTQCTADLHLTPSTSEGSHSTAQLHLRAWSEEYGRIWMEDVNGDTVADIWMLFEDPLEVLAVVGNILPQLHTSGSLISKVHVMMRLPTVKSLCPPLQLSTSKPLVRSSERTRTSRRLYTSWRLESYPQTALKPGR